MKLTNSLMFGADTQKRALKTLVSTLGDLLRKEGFEKSRAYEWSRSNAWKREDIDLVVKRGSQLWILPSFYVSLTGASIVPFQTNIGRYLYPKGGPVFDIKVPYFGFGISKFVNRTVADVQAAFHWFDAFATPEDCKQRLHLHVKPGCPAYIDIQFILTSLIEANLRKQDGDGRSGAARD